jgi:hypothetical protein
MKGHMKAKGIGMSHEERREGDSHFVVHELWRQLGEAITLWDETSYSVWKYYLERCAGSSIGLK